ncbi:MAG: hypothetical protein JNK87_14070 [Bryobacterales bacterium]|nr:hypothetical protein [Bryobacterales bacterium]
MHIHEPLDRLVFSNAWRMKTPLDKLLLGGGLLLHASLLPPLPWAAVIFAIAAAAALGGARIPWRAWLRFLMPQMAFVAAAVLPVWWANGPWVAVGLALRAAAGAASLTLLSLTTPVPDLLQAARRAHVPAALVEVAFLAYRLIASVYELLGRLRLGLHLRLRGNKLRLTAVSISAGNLLVRSLRTAQRLEQGAALRGLGGYPLLAPRTHRSLPFRAGVVATQGALLASAWLLRGMFPW